MFKRDLYRLLLRYDSFLGDTVPYEGTGYQAAIPPLQESLQHRDLQENSLPFEYYLAQILMQWTYFYVSIDPRYYQMQQQANDTQNQNPADRKLL